jgi:hypothetical protein
MSTYTATVTLTLTLSGNGKNDTTPILAQWQNQSSPGICTQVTLAAGTPYTVTPPTSPQNLAGMAIIQLPPGVSVTWKGVSGDTGYAMGTVGSQNVALMVPLNQVVPGSFVLLAVAQAVVSVWFV